ncbi:hypothetical protein [Paenibacillus peoriae]|uniref:hypothetical protein n=1 Tax=Paenibacillus peoriae TaxID=59893 RepID=UPI00096D6543|nr:hypothetical protein [Paenibacillus peoriae]OMF48584.1 hypothetical protein BK135_09815 [Paenibacillus peoriae]
MAVYMVSYDLNGADKDYSGLIEALGTFGTCLHVLESTWLIEANSARQVYDVAAPYIDKDDEILVIRVESEYKAYLQEKASEWIREVLG